MSGTANIATLTGAARKLQRERLKSIEPKPEAVADFVAFTQVSRSSRLRAGSELDFAL